ncbi:MAG: C25 family cysteine peptidase [Saprospiraceae bacterium]|nr:C25 family cysteine peptidase [Saprospiraceae bacterium]
MGHKNRGTFDRTLYEDPDAEHLNPYYSMFTDSAAYFLAVTDAGVGARITPIENDLNNLPDPEACYMHEDLTLLTNSHFGPRLQPSSGVAYSHYVAGEGFTGVELSNHAFEVISSDVAAAGDSARLEMRVVAANLTGHELAVTLAGDTIYRQVVPGTSMRTVRTSLDPSGIQASMSLHVDDLIPGGRLRVAYIKWRYPRQLTFDNAGYVQFAHASNNSRQYFELDAFSHGGEDAIVYDLSNGTRLLAQPVGEQLHFALPAGNARDLYVASQASGIRMINALTPVSFTDWSQDNTSFIILSNGRLRTGSDEIGAYLDYRASAAGGSYTTGFYDVREIYDQFGYGIVRHPQAIRNFAQFVYDNWAAAQLVLIVGKGLEYSFARNCEADCHQWFFVPTFGTPGADNLLFTLPGERLPFVGVGRIPVIDNEEVGIYLNKVKEHDAVTSLPQTLADRAWTKNILHLGGGADRDQQDLILSHLAWMEGIIETSLFGGTVTTYSKSNTNPTGESNSELIIKLLEEGVSVVKFFGHSSASTLDFQINNPREWNNKGKYPIFSAMGCAAGQIHRDFRSLGEIFVLEPNAGAIAFLAGSGSQFLNPLADWGGEWYGFFGNAYQATTLGHSVNEGSRPMSMFSGFTSRILVEQQTLTGDPALRFYPSSGRDYTWDFESVQVTPEILTTNLDSFDLTADLVNIGVNAPDLVELQVEQQLPDGSRFVVAEKEVFVDRFRTTISFRVPMHKRSSGINRFYLTVDQNDLIAELPDPAAELNNVLANSAGVEGIEVFVLDNRALATYPPEFAIVTETNIELVASSTNAFAKGNTFVLQIDTTATFDSPVMASEIFKPVGGVVKWRPDVNLIPGTVYYWRVGLEGGGGPAATIWDISSFLYAPGSSRGWNQSHYYQYLRNDFDGIGVGEDRKFAFETGIKNVWVQNAVDTGSVERFQFFVDNTNFISFYRPWKPYEAHIFVAVYDPKTGKTVKNPPGGQYGAINPFGNQRPVFPFSTASPESRNDLITFLDEIVPPEHYVVMYTYQRGGFLDYFPEDWAMDSVQYGRNLFSFIESIYPESDIRTLEDGSVPYTLFFQKDVAVIREQVAADFDATINVDANFTVVNTSGNAHSTIVGPASAWHQVEWAFENVEDEDTLTLSIYALTHDLTDSLVADRITDLSWSLAGLDAAKYPFISLRMDAADPTDARTAPQLTYWRVYFDGEAEFVINPDAGFAFHSDTLPFGDSLHFMSVVENVSVFPSQPVSLQYTVVDRNNATIESSEVVPALAPGETATIRFDEQMVMNSRNHRFIVTLNELQATPELHHFNNFGLREFYVMPDETRPRLDVTFDGRHLVDGDVVSAQPEIIVALSDEAGFLPVSDPELFTLEIKTPSSFEFEEIDLTGPEVTFSPSAPSQGDHTASVTWRPSFAEDGFYAFRANARDASGNQPGLFYEVNFEVLGRQRIANVQVSPNPFRDRVRFRFVITGHQPPAEFSIVISDVTGKPVRVLSPDVPVGSSEVIWNGESDGGGQVPAGVYFYQIDARDQAGQPYLFELLNSESGKVVLIR